MEKQNDITKITDEDLLYVKTELDENKKPEVLHVLSKKLAYKKNATQLSQEVKIYDPQCEFKIGDLIYKEYDEPLVVSSKGTEHFKGGVVLKVVNKIVFEDYGEMLEVDYTGGGVFRKHIDFMKKTKTQVLLPSKQSGQTLIPEKLQKEEDPRLRELPMTEKDLKNLMRNLQAEMNKSPDFFNWNDLWQLEKNRIEIKDKTIKDIAAYFKKNNQPDTTENLVSKFLDIKQSEEIFDIYCMSLNFHLEKKHRKDFIFVSSQGWGEWFLKDILDSFLTDLPLLAPKIKLPELKGEKDFILPQIQKFPLRVYLTWREICSSGILIPKSLNRELSNSRKYICVDSESGDEYSVYYYPNKNFILGFKEFYEKNSVPQGASLTLERESPVRFNLTLKKSRKGISAPQVTYNSKNNTFVKADQDMYTNCIPHKVIHLESETLENLVQMYKEIQGMDLHQLLIHLFKNFGLEGENSSLHFLRAYHLADMLRRTSQEDVEKVLHLSEEFIPSEKAKGLFLYIEKSEIEEEREPEKKKVETAETRGEEKIAARNEELFEIGTVGEITYEHIKEQEVKVVEPAPPEPKTIESEKIKHEKPKSARTPKPFQKKEPLIPPAPEAEKFAAPLEEKEKAQAKKEKPAKKKKQKAALEMEKTPRKRKGERKFIEEKIELEESELEALYAEKFEEKKDITEESKEPSEKETPIDYQQFISQGTLSGGLFGEKLKTALDKKKDDKKKETKKKK
jgi:hypothetical protein